MNLRSGDDRLPASLRGQAFSVPPGPSILELLWAEMDAQLSKLLALPTPQDREVSAASVQYRAQQGHCLGLAKAIAILTNPYDPDVGAVRREAMERHYRHA